MTRFGKGTVGGLVAVLLLVGLAPLAPHAAGATAVAEDEGTTGLLGGGDHRFIRFGNDAAFGVLWGTAANPNNIYLLAIKARYLGVVDVKTAAGATIVSDRPIRVYTIYALKLENLIEFDDTNGDGIASYTRNHNAANYTTYVETEPLSKRVSLNTSWTPSAVTRTDDGAGTRSWTFSLTATNLTYIAIGGGSTNGMLEEATFTFHLTTTTVHVDGVSVPQYGITVQQSGGRWAIVNATRDGFATWSGDRLRYTVKWDQRFVGWDYRGSNNNPGLVLEIGAIVANRIPTDVGDWFSVAVVWRLHEGGALAWRDAAGAGTVDENSTYAPNRRLRDPWVNAGGNWSSIGNLTWVSNCTVDGGPGQVYAQIQGGIAGLVRTADGIYIGFAVLIGLSFPGGNEIEHDPAMESEAFEITPATGGGGFGVLLVAGVALLFVIFLFALLVSAARRRRDERQEKTLRPPP